MKKLVLIGLCSALLGAAVAMAAVAAKAKTYQVTGPVVELTDAKIVVLKGDTDKWEIARDADTKLTGEAKVGDKVTVEYRMTATKIEAKAKADAKAK